MRAIAGGSACLWSADELYDILDGAIMSLTSALNDLDGVEEYLDWVGTLEDVRDEMESERALQDMRAFDEYREEMRLLNRDYERSVL